MSPSPSLSAALALALASLAAGCQASPPEPSPDRPGALQAAQPGDHGQKMVDQAGGHPQTPGEQRPAPQTPEAPRAPRPMATVQPSPDDPLQGKFTLDDATKGLPPGKQIVATIDTSMGKIECKLLDDKAPITVANFVGLARGVRPWKTPEGTWEKKPAYDGTVFHRIIKGFMIQGGDAKKNGSGEAGYVIPDEVWAGATHDRAGLLCMANRGKNTNSAQFFITDGAALHLNSGYTIFGECGPVDLVHKIAEVEVQGDRPKSPPDIKKITVTRK